MSIVVTTDVSVDWTRTREQLAIRALRKIRQLGTREQPDPEELADALDDLDALLKNLQWRGIDFPKRASGSQALSYLTPNASLALPFDFYGDEMVTYTNSANQEIGLYKVSPEDWKSILVKPTTADYPDRYYIDNFNKLWPYPVPNQNLTFNLYYQKVIQDTISQTPVDLDSPWMLGLVYGLCSEIAEDYNVGLDWLQRYESKWNFQLDLGIKNEAPPGPDRIQVSD